MTKLAPLAFALALAAGCKVEPKVQAAAPQPAPVPKPVVAPVIEPVKPPAPQVPPDGQVLRDAEGYMMQHMDELRDHMRPLTIETKERDTYEPDMAATVTKMKLNWGRTYRAIAVYRRQENFWRLVDMQGRIQ